MRSSFLERKREMSRIDNAIYEIHHMDEIACRDQWVNEIHPLVKLLLTVFYIVLVMSYDKYDIIGLIGMVIYLIAGFILSELSLWDSIKRIRIVLPLVCIIGLFNPVFEREALFKVGDFIFTNGMMSMITLMLKGIFSVLASYLFVATTTIDKICYSLRLLHIPAIIVTQVMLMYRYISLLLEEAGQITQAYFLRAPRQKGIHFKVWGSLVGQLLLRSMDRAEAVYESMCIRGYKGEFYYSKKRPVKLGDIVWLIFWVIILAVFRYISVIALVGKVFNMV